MQTALAPYLASLPFAWQAQYHREHTLLGLPQLFMAILDKLASTLPPPYGQRQLPLAAELTQLFCGTLIISAGLDLTQELPSALAVSRAWIAEGIVKLQRAADSNAKEDVALQIGLAGALFSWSLLLQQAGVAYAVVSASSCERNFAEKGLQNYARGFCTAVLQLSQSEEWHTYLTALLPLSPPGVALPSGQPDQALISQLAVVMLTLALAVLHRAYAQPLTGRAWRAIVEDPIPSTIAVEGDSSATPVDYVYALWMALQVHIALSGVERELLLTILAAHYDEVVDSTALIEPYELLTRAFVDLTLPRGQIYA